MTPFVVTYLFYSVCLQINVTKIKKYILNHESSFMKILSSGGREVTLAVES